MVVNVAKVMWDNMSENISVTNNLALAMRNVLVWLTPYVRITEIYLAGDGTVFVSTDSDKNIVIERFKVNDIIESY
jgi:hypothetical protein